MFFSFSVTFRLPRETRAPQLMVECRLNFENQSSRLGSAAQEEGQTRQTQRQTERERVRERESVCVCVLLTLLENRENWPRSRVAAAAAAVFTCCCCCVNNVAQVCRGKI